MITVAAFNNKGGVGKTTLTCNIAAYFARNMRKRVLVVDCDPQCNATQLIMGSDTATEMYWTTGTSVGITTIRDILRPIEDGDSGIDTKITPFLSSQNRFNVDVISGHPGFAIIEDRLGAAWHELLGGDLGGARKTNWNAALRTALDARYDVAFFDLGPSLGSINRSVLIGCDYFFTPMGTDIFSILGIRNISQWLSLWGRRYDQALQLVRQQYHERLDEFTVQSQLKIKSGYVGYTMQQYITKSFGGERRPTRAYDEIIGQVPTEVAASLGQYFADSVSGSSAHLGDIPHLYSLIPLAQSVAAPIIDLQASDGLVGSQYRQRSEYTDILGNIATTLASNISLG